MAGNSAGRRTGQPIWPKFRAFIGRNRHEVLLISCLLLVGLIIRLPTLHQPLLEEGRSFRQTQTAYPALLFHQQGINLFAPQLPVLGKPWQVPFEFPAFQALAALLMNAGLAPDFALRVVGVVSFMGCAVAIWSLVRYISTPVAAAVTLLVFLFLPFDVIWSRTSNIDYLATGLAVAWALFGILWLDRRRAWFALAAIFLGSLAMLIKPLDAIFWLAPAILYRPLSEARGWLTWLRTRLMTGAVLGLVPLGLAVLWTLHTDAIKSATPATAWLTNRVLVGFYFGDLGQRFNLTYWEAIAHRLEMTGFPGWLLVALMAVACIHLIRRRQIVWLGIVIAAVLPIVVFFNGYFKNVYYLIAVTPALAAIVGYVCDYAVGWLRSISTRAVASAVLVVWLGATLYVAGPQLAPIYKGPPYRFVELSLARELAARTKPSDLIVFDGFDWNPSIPYYSRRRGLMLANSPAFPQLLDTLRGQGYRFLFTPAQNGRYSARTLEVLQRWRWFGVLSRHLFALGDSYGGVSRASLVVSATPLAPPPGLASLLSAQIAVPCGGPPQRVSVPAGSTVTLEFTGRLNSTSISIDGLWTPGDATVVVSRGLDSSGLLNLTCRGSPSVLLAAMYASHP